MGQTPIEGRPSRIGIAQFVLRQKISLLPAVIFSGYQNPSPFPRHNGQSGRRVRPGGSRPPDPNHPQSMANRCNDKRFVP